MKLPLLLSLLLLASANLTAQEIKLQSHSGDTSLPHKLLLEVMQRAGLTYSHPYDKDKDVSNTRILNDVKTGALDVMWSMTSSSLEAEYQAIYFPLFRGLLGMRLAIVKQADVNLFSRVRTLADLQQFTAGQGKTWPDTQILEANGLRVAKTLKYPNLFPMLEGGRFDYFPRGINEPWDEIDRYQDLKLVVEPHVLLKYTAPLYFFIHKDNRQLAEQMNSALNAMVADGSFERMFFEDSQVQSALRQANLRRRVIIELQNPQLTDKTPLDRRELWFDPLGYQVQGN
jgi:hypothetical protein